MNQAQKDFILIVLSKLTFLLILYHGFWVFIYEFAWWNKTWWFAFMSSATNLVLVIVYFFLHCIFELWIRYPHLRPSLRIERGRKAKAERKADEGEKLPLF